MTEYFKVKYSKKGMLPSGVAEDVYVHFTPDTYKYYYDCLRIHCEGEKLLLPIHSYPVVNTKTDRLTPKQISLGPIDVGETAKREIKIESNSPVSFEFTIQIEKPHPFICIEPTSGIIEGMKGATISVEYMPGQLPQTGENLGLSHDHQALFKFITTEFGSDPEEVHILGRVKPSKTKVEQMRESQKGKTLLETKPSRPPSAKGTKLDRINEGLLTKEGKQIATLTARSDLETQRAPLAGTAMEKLDPREKDFLIEYRDLEKLD